MKTRLLRAYLPILFSAYSYHLEAFFCSCLCQHTYHLEEDLYFYPQVVDHPCTCHQGEVLFSLLGDLLCIYHLEEVSGLQDLEIHMEVVCHLLQVVRISFCHLEDPLVGRRDLYDPGKVSFHLEEVLFCHHMVEGPHSLGLPYLEGDLCVACPLGCRIRAGMVLLS